MSFGSVNKSPAAFQTLAIALISVALFVALSIWAGIPTHIPLGFFILGAGIFFFSMVVFGLAFWHLMVRPLPAGHKVPAYAPFPATYRKLIAALAAVSGICIVIGGFWDEMWHRTYGLPFGEDLLWRPHLLLYIGFLSVSVLAGLALLVLVQRGSGTLQQRFRAQPVLGLLVLIGGFLIFAIPADPVWHTVYGADITAWSLPHLILTASFGLIMLLSAAIQLTTIEKKQWQNPLKIRGTELLVVLVYAFMLIVLLQVLTTEWDVLSRVEGGSGNAFWQRPAWLLPAVIAAVTAFTSALANHSLQTYGAATMMAGLAFVIRYTLVTLLGVEQMTADGWIVALAPAIAMDLSYALTMIFAKRPPVWYVAGLGAMLGMSVLGLPLVNQFYVYPSIEGNNLVSMLVAVLVACLGGVWLGRLAGEYLATANKQGENAEEAQKLSKLQWIPGAAFVVVVAFIIFFMATATPPV